MHKITKEDYPYVSLEDGERQYDSLNFDELLSVDALYVHAASPDDAGNRFIEALPLPRNSEETQEAYKKELFSYDRAKIEEMKSRPELTVSCIEMLRQIRFPLPFHRQLDTAVNNALLNTYRARYQLRDRDIFISPPLSECISPDPPGSCGKLVGDAADSAIAGFALLGYSGCGKSSALKIALSHYPQVIVHSTPDGKFTQVVYLVVNCVANSNFSALYAGIGDALDRALGLINGCYTKQISSKKSLGEKADKICELIETFGIGLIVFDEIQLIDFSTSKENSFDSLMTLVNRTKVAIAAVGTEDAYTKMFSKLRTARRVGTLIHGNQYCDNQRSFSFLVQAIIKYQWFDELIELTQELIDALYENTGGIIALLISLYIYMNIDYLSRRKRPEVSPEYVRNIADKYYHGIRDLIKTCKDPLNDKKRQKILTGANEKLDALLDDISQNEYAREIEDRLNRNGDLEIIKSRVVKNLQNCSDFSERQILKVLRKILSDPESQVLDEMSLILKVHKVLCEKSSAVAAPKKSTAKPDSDTMMELITSHEKSA